MYLTLKNMLAFLFTFKVSPQQIYAFFRMEGFHKLQHVWKEQICYWCIIINPVASAEHTPSISLAFIVTPLLKTACNSKDERHVRNRKAGEAKHDYRALGNSENKT